VSRITGYKLSNYLGDIFDLLRPKCDVSHLSLESPDIDLNHEVIELCLTTFESLIRRCPKEVTSLIEPMVDMVALLVAYDPNYSYD